MKLEREAFIDAARSDFEFTRETRYLTGVVKFDFGDQTWALSFVYGSLGGITDGSKIPDGDCRIIVGGTPEQWGELLQLKPQPFYQCIQSAAVKHGMKISATNETFAYLPALNRAVVLLRELSHGRA